MRSLNVEKRWIVPLVISSLVSVFLLVTSFDIGLISSFHTINSVFSIFPSRVMENQTSSFFGEVKVQLAPSSPPPPPPPSPPPPPPPPPPAPRFAYLISGSNGDLHQLWRTLKSLYHPWNYYIVHLDLKSSAKERLELASRVAKEPVFAKVGNVHMITKANMVTYRGPTMVSNTLHAASILLKKYNQWDWFINLSASDYPLLTQDDLLYTFSQLKRDLNFIEHTSRLRWKESQRAMPLIIDPGLYQNTKSDIFWVSPRRTLPTAFKLFTGSAWTVQSRAFVEYCIWGWDNLPRNLLMYYSNFVSSPEGYFQTVVCNAPEFSSTVLNHDLHYISWDVPPKQHPQTLSLNDIGKMIASGAAFARKFKIDDPAIDKIDQELLHRGNASFTPGGWCAGNPTCSEVGNPIKLRPGPGAQRLRRLIDRLVDTASQDQCK
ncbi:Beta-glucuronosyltransferase GlcAT14A [Datura stramonium]|uniref:Beta-glucuronosyltransferase GlcAT14A n=1 Tax=Datura stramonium TaxID=4076 RepID=A0ABS8W031_DATST|nr:Beta-glucuronosyltransferase GlcAT14A [Datura stramonium]